jgi:hypothetical protein
MTVLFECGACVGKKSVVAFSFALFLRSSFLLFRLFWGLFLLCEDSHVVWGVVVGSECRVKNVQWGTMFCVKGRLEVFSQDIGGVVSKGHSPYAHIAFHVILFDFMVAYVNGPGVFGVVGLGGDVFSRLVIGV